MSIRRSFSVVSIAMLLAAAAGTECAGDQGPRRPRYDPLTMDFPVSPGQARQAACAWAGNPDLVLDLDHVEDLEGYVTGIEPVRLFEDVYEPRYKLYTEDGGQCFGVGVWTGEVLLWVDNVLARARGVRLNGGADPALALPPEQLTITATAFAEAYNPGFQSRNMQILPEYVGAAGCTFNSVLPSGAFYSNDWLIIAWDQWTGEPYRYDAAFGPTPLATGPPSITSQQAGQYALDWALGQLEVQSAFILDNTGRRFVSIDRAGVQREGWDVRVVSCDIPNATPAYYAWELEERDPDVDGPEHCEPWCIYVDVYTGEVWLAQSLALLGPDPEGAAKARSVAAAGTEMRTRSKGDGIPVKRENPCKLADIEGRKIEASYPPRIIQGVPYIYVRYMPALKQDEVKWRNGEVQVACEGQLLRLRPGSASVEAPGRTIHLDAPVLNLDGRVYVPLDVFQKLGEAKARYDAKSRTVYLGVPVRPTVRM